MVRPYQLPNFIHKTLDRLRGNNSGKVVLQDYLNMEINPWLQPIICADSSQVVGAEVLLRFRDCHGQLLTPTHVIEDLEASRHIHHVTLELMESTGESFLPIIDLLPAGFFITFNICASQLDNPALKEAALKFMRTLNNRVALVFEIVERSMLQINDYVLASIEALMDCGVQFAIDDFGSGYSSLKYLENMGFGMLKLDRELTLAYNGELIYRKTIAALAGLTRSLNIRITAEGIESQEQATLLIQCGVDLLQGFFYARPQPAQQFVSGYLL